MQKPTRELSVDELYQACDPDRLSFDSTTELEDLQHLVAQERATEAVELGTSIRVEGYNLFLLGRDGTGRHTFIREFLRRKAAAEAPACDWCYVNNFAEPRKPRALRLAAGRGRELEADVTQLLDDAHTAVPAAFESEDYRTRRQAIEDEVKEEQEKAFEEVNKEAKERGVGIMQTPTGIAFAPLHRDEPISPREFELLPKDAQDKLKQAMSELGQKFQASLQAAPQRIRKARNRIRELDREIAAWALGGLIQALKDKYGDCPDALDYLGSVEGDIVENVALFRLPSDAQSPIQQMLTATMTGRQPEESPAARRYSVNVLVDHQTEEGAPVVFEDHPTHQRVLGDIEHVPQMGTLVTDFRMIKGGSLHRANGGYLVLDARKVLSQPFVWEGLKRAIQSRELRIQTVGQAYGFASTVSLEPEAIPLSAKVALIGDRMLYYLLQALDPEFSRLFKVAADFEDELDRNPENTELYARLLATLARREELKPLDRTAVARLIEESARQASDGQKLSAQIEAVADIIREADYWAQKNGSEHIAAPDVERAIDAQLRRNSRLHDRLQDEILRETILIDTEGERVGQINGLSVIALGGFAFGRPTRISGRVSMGSGKVIDIEREVDLGGAIHSKGVLILSSYLAAQYTVDRPLSLSASLVFEQSYGGVDGDSASCAELCALLSSLARIPIKQSLAITGSVNQHGDVQAIGGVNQKIEGFFDICKARGLNGDHGVLIPVSNVKHLMLRRDVREAVGEGRFHVYPVKTIDDCIEALMGLPAGTRDAEGRFPEGSVNQRVTARLLELADKRRSYAKNEGTRADS